MSETKDELPTVQISLEATPNIWHLAIRYGCEVSQIVYNVEACRPAEHQLLSQELPFMVKAIAEETCNLAFKDGIFERDPETPSGFRVCKKIDWDKMHAAFGLQTVERSVLANTNLAQHLPIEEFLAPWVTSDPVDYEYYMDIMSRFLGLAKEVRSAPPGRGKRRVVMRLSGILTGVDEFFDFSAQTKLGVS